MLTTTMTDHARQAVQLLDATRKWGATPPKAIVAAEKDTAARLEQIDAVAREAEGLETVTLECLAKGSDPLTDEAVKRGLGAQQLVKSAGWQRAKLRAHAPLEAAVVANVDALIESWREPFTTAARALVDAHAVLGDCDLDDSTAVLAVGGDAAGHWHAARAAEATINNIVGQWKTAAAWTQVTARYPQLILTGGSMPLARYQTTPAKFTPWTLTKREGLLTLATPAEYKDGAAKLEAEQARVNAEAQATRNQRNPHAFGTVEV